MDTFRDIEVFDKDIAAHRLLCAIFPTRRERALGLIRDFFWDLSGNEDPEKISLFDRVGDAFDTIETVVRNRRVDRDIRKVGWVDV